MKKFVQIACLLALVLVVFVSRAFAYENEDDKGVSVTDISVVRAGDAAKVTFALHVGDKVTAENKSLIIDPVLQNENGKVSLYPIVVRGSRARAENEERAMEMAQLSTEMPYHTSNGRTVEYVATIPWESWMRGSELVFNGISAGAGKANEVAIGLVADGLLTDASDMAVPANDPDQARNEVAAAILGDALERGTLESNVVQRPIGSVDAAPTGVKDSGTVVQRPVGQSAGRSLYASAAPRGMEDYYIPSAPPVETRRPTYISVGDELASRFMFVEPVNKYYEALKASSETVFDYTMPLILGTGVQQTQSEVDRFIEMTRKGSVFIQFNLGSQIVGRDFANNNTMLVDLISSIRLLEGNPDVRVAHVVIAGFSAPEGTFAENEKLALDRAAVARDFLTANSGIDPKVISVYNGSIDWTTLRALIAESNMPEKYTILNIIDNTPAWDTFRDRGRLERLMAVNNGMAYRYISEHFFPQLRQTGAYIKVYYENIR